MTDQGDEMDETTIALHECVDMEQHARSFNEGYETAVAQGLADDPTLAGDWLEEHDRKVKRAVLDEVASRISAGAAQEPDTRERVARGDDVRIVAALRRELSS